MDPRLREYTKQGHVDVVSKSRNEIHQTWCTDFSQSLYCGGTSHASTVQEESLRYVFI